MRYNTVDYFKKVTGYDIQSFLYNYTVFAGTYYNQIVRFYNGGDIDRTAFNFFDDLKTESSKIESLIDQYSYSFNNTDFWQIEDMFSDIQCRLSTVDAMSRWQRSSRLNRYSASINIDYIQSQNQTLENISSRTGSADPDNWVNIALDNQVIEEDYTMNGGKLLKLTFKNNLNFNLTNIVDNLSSDNLYGKDIKSTLSIIDSDIVCIYGKEAVEQSFGTIITTIKGSIPEFPEDGMPDYLFSGNQNILQYPILFRSISSMLSKDDRFNSLEILDIAKDQDNVFIKLQTTVKTGDVLKRDLAL
jgi:hypothetical protein